MICLEHQYGRRDVMLKRSILEFMINTGRVTFSFFFFHCIFTLWFASDPFISLLTSFSFCQSCRSCAQVILRKLYWSYKQTISSKSQLRIFNVQIYIWSLFKAQEVYFSGNKKINRTPMKLSKLFCFKDTRSYYFFLVAGIKISQRANATAIRVWCKWIHPTISWRRDEQGTHKHTRLVDSVLYHVFVSKQCILCSALRHKGYLTLAYTLHRFGIHSPWNFRPRSLTEADRQALQLRASKGIGEEGKRKRK